MGIETRNGKGAYFYRKRRVGGHIVSEYVGSGEMALLADAHARREKEKRKVVLKAFREQSEKAAVADKILTELSDRLDVLVRAYLVSEGYRMHKGEWRRRRVTKN